MMKNFVSIISMILILVICAMAFSGCGSKEEEKKVDTVEPATSASENNTASNNSEDDYEIVYVFVTDSNGNKVTNKNNEAITKASKVYKTKKAVETVDATTQKADKAVDTTAQIADGGTDPFVEDPF